VKFTRRSLPTIAKIATIVTAGTARTNARVDRVLAEAVLTINAVVRAPNMSASANMISGWLIDR
jgi:hypothetical protein